MQPHPHAPDPAAPRTVVIHADRIALAGDLAVPPHATGLVVFAHGSGSSRLSPRNRGVARALVRTGFATLLFDLLAPEEAHAERYTHHLRFDVDLLARRLVATLGWVARQGALAALPVGLFGASTGAAAALIAASRADVAAVVSRGGRPDLAGTALDEVGAPTLLVVGGNDVQVLELNRAALAHLGDDSRLHVVPGAGHLFEEPGALDEVTRVAETWFLRHLGPART